MKIAYCAERKADFLARGYTEEEAAEYNDDEVINGIMSAIKSLGHDVEYVGDVKELARRLVAADTKGGMKLPWDLVWNDIEGTYGVAGRESQSPGLLEAYRVPYTHSDAATMALCLDKGLTKMFFEYHGIPTAPFAVVPNNESDYGPIANGYTNGVSNGHVNGNTNGSTHISRARAAIAASRHRDELQNYPLFVKPVAEGTSKGIFSMSKCSSPEELDRVVDQLVAKFPGQNILIESFLPGREMTVGIAGTGSDAKVIGIREIDWIPGKVDFMSLDEKIDKITPLPEQTIESTPDPNTDTTAKEASELALKVWRLIGCRDMGRIDLRCDKTGRVCVIEVNPIAGLTEGYSHLCLAADAFGNSYKDLFRMVIESACKRYGLDPVTGSKMG